NKKFIKDVVTGTLERYELIEETITIHLSKDIDLKKTDKLLKPIFTILPTMFYLYYASLNLICTVRA
ncbi:MAG: hypothetical protein ACPGLV_10390, partial [Bacteroidia bacterium]